MSSQPLLGNSVISRPPTPRQRTFSVAVVAVLAVLVVVLVVVRGSGSGSGSDHNGKPLPSCAQLPALVPSGDASVLERFSKNRSYILAAAERLAGAVRISTESYDTTRGVPPPLEGDDPFPQHKGFEQLHEYLHRSFPRVSESLERKVINRYALLYTWKGSDASLPPLVLMAHMDTVPVLPDTLDQWIHPPFSGFVDLENDAIWGRGSVDTKPTLVGSLEAIEVLLESGFVPRKTVYLAFGYDEEISGIEGARKVAEYMEQELNLVGKVGMVLDEGLDSLTNVDGFDMAVVSTAEKGYLDYHMTVETPGGHSSIPPLHTGIGLMSQLVNALEANPFPIKLTETNPYLGSIVCSSEHSKNKDAFIDDALFHFDTKSQALADYLAARSLKDRYRMASSQAIDIINGGLKVNALPELVTVDLNNRISIDSSVDEFQHTILNNLKPVAVKYNLNFTFYDFLHNDKVLGSYKNPSAIGNVKVFGKSTDSPLEPSPISPIHSPEWNVIEGTIHHVYERPEAYGAEKGKVMKYIVSPGLMAGNTDTRYFWNMSKNIFRFAPAPGGQGYHTVNERASIKGYMTALTFFVELIRNYDEL
ncbi:carboxypeptidase S [Rhizoclosmatium globosum]|uniref:Carboxypeptidase S n=1 Tax=Rhizoclosmatium globosum TaxID=329046 RepID=A0A1Y2C7R2_9FUNG|nr:hypothetical protein HDU79_004455 [Rhizoclosmatium sp. JEL0117]ORY43071.1 carboxypeptidase S [Rhizoclosmatium globosum]|eukprot:ORY43071.1 carboxypeptidase S [Rhizoclosmatium globosum]